MKRLIILLVTSFMCAISIAQVSKSTSKAVDKPPLIGIGAESNANVKQLPIVPEKFPEGMKVEVIEYDPEYDVFNVAESGYSEQGPFYVTPEDILAATKFAISPEDFNRQKKNDFVGSEHTLKSDLKMLSEEEYKARKK